MNNYNNNYIKHVPDFVYNPATIQQQQPIEDDSKKNFNNYICKFKTAFYSSILFIMFSLPITYKILDMLAKLLSKNIDIINGDCEEPQPLGRIIMGIFVGIILFII
jgi:hypothetical protein